MDGFVAANEANAHSIEKALIDFGFSARICLGTILRFPEK
jgi:hypothetical protein